MQQYIYCPGCRGSTFQLSWDEDGEEVRAVCLNPDCVTAFDPNEQARKREQRSAETEKMVAVPS